MDKFSFIALWDVDGGLLTANRKEIADMYFNLDLTVSEIAQEKGITRQAVSDCLKSCKRQLEEYEEKLNVLKKLREISLRISFMLTDAGIWAESFKSVHGEFAEEIDGLLKILEKDYTEEVGQVLKSDGNLEILYKNYNIGAYGKRKTDEF